MGNRELSQPIRKLSVPGQFLTGGQICTEHRPRRGCAAEWGRCHRARTRMSPNKHGGTLFRDVGRKWNFCPSCSALSDNMWFWYWHDPEVNETCNKMCQTRRICILPCRRPFKQRNIKPLGYTAPNYLIIYLKYNFHNAIPRHFIQICVDTWNMHYPYDATVGLYDCKLSFLYKSTSLLFCSQLHSSSQKGINYTCIGAYQ